MSENKITSSVLKRAVTALLLSGLVLGGCGFGLTDSGYESTASINPNEYLELGVFDRTDDEIMEKSYETYTLEYGTFVTEQTAGASVFEPITYQEKAKIESGTMVFNEFLVSEMDYVKAGDPIASVSPETDSISIKEAELSLQRLKTQYEEAVKSREESIADRDEIYRNLKTDEEKKIRLLQWQIADLNWQKTEASYKERIKSSEDSIAEQKKRANTKTISAEHSGYVYSLEKIEAGTYLKNGQNLLVLVPTNNLYLEMNDKDMIYTYGKQYTVTVRVGRNNKYEFEAYTINPPLCSLYFNMNTGKAYLIVNAQMATNIPRASITVSGVASTIENVLLVPYDAVEKEDNCCFVTVMNEDGTIARLPFISGGNNRNYYWVISGLDAGMKVIHE